MSNIVILEKGSDPFLVLRPVVGRFLGYRDVVHVAFLDTGAGHAHELRLDAHLVDAGATRVAHGCADATDELVTIDLQAALETLAPGASVARIAREHEINANQLFTWRRQFAPTKRETQVADRQVPPPASLVPVAVVADESAAANAPTPATDDGQIEIRLAGATLRIRGAVDAATLQVVLASLRR